MLKRRGLYWFMSVVSLLFFSTAAFADTVQGRVAGISPTTLDMTVFDSQGRPYPNTLHLKVDNHTRLNGFSSPTTLRKQDLVNVDVRQQRAGVWRADSISKLQNVGNVQPPASSPSASLMDALRSPTGQKVIRNGLTGAITGAVASGASGGKAGKGALIGAGAGIAGGFLADLFSQHPQSQTSPAAVSDQQDTRR